MIEEWALERDAKEFRVYRQDGVFFVDGTIVQEILARTDPDDPDSLRHFQKLLKDFGIIKTLRREGATTGDSVCLEGMEFDFVD